MDYPRYKREEKLNTKLSENDILEIKELKEKGLSLIKIGNLYNVSGGCIYYICCSEEKREEHRKYLKEYARNRYFAGKDAQTVKKFRARKKLIKTKELKDFENSSGKRYYHNNTESRKSKISEYYKNNKEKLAPYYKNYYKEHREYYLNSFKERYKLNKMK